MVDKQNQGPQCTACGSPMRLMVIEPSMWGQDLRTFACPHCTGVQWHAIESNVTEAWVSQRTEDTGCRRFQRSSFELHAPAPYDQCAARGNK